MRNVYKQVYKIYRTTIEELLTSLLKTEDVPSFDVRRAAIGLSGLLDGLWLQQSLDPRAVKVIDAIRACEDWVTALCQVKPSSEAIELQVDTAATEEVAVLDA
jgi:hypothetical protein